MNLCFQGIGIGFERTINEPGAGAKGVQCCLKKTNENNDVLNGSWCAKSPLSKVSIDLRHFGYVNLRMAAMCFIIFTIANVMIILFISKCCV